MILIALAEGNPTFCQALKTMLEQVDDFRVVVMQPDNFCQVIENNPSFSILLVDEDIYQVCRKRLEANKLLQSTLKTLVLTMHHNELLCPQGHEIIFKGSGKREFEERIRSNLSILP